MDLVPIIALSRRLRNTPFTSRVLRYGVKAFTVYNHMLLPTEFHSLEEDYWHLCSSVQVWDVSVERQVSIKGPDATRLVQLMTPRKVADIGPNRCVYVPLAGPTGKLINDPVALRLEDDHWWLSIADSDVALWAQGLAWGAGLNVHVDEPDVWPLAIQGPKAEELMVRVFGPEVADIRFFRYRKMPYQQVEFIVARSGWSKQGGFEIYVNDVEAGQQLYDELFVKGQDLSVRPGCPNLIERMESTLLSYGNDMDSRHSVLESGLGHFIDLDADVESLSIEALRQERDRGAQRRLMGLVVLAPDGPRRFSEQPFARQLGLSYSTLHLPEDIAQQSVLRHCLGSQVYSPRHRVQLATATIDEPLASEESCEVLMADGEISIARICTLPFKPEDFIVDGPLAEDVVIDEV